MNPLAATLLLFVPHYQVTRDLTPVSVVADVNGNAYVVTGNMGSLPTVGYLTKVDRDGRVIYRVALSETSVGGIYPTPTSDGSVYAAVLGHLEGTNFTEFYAVKLDTAGNIVYRVPLQSNSARAPAVAADGSAYFTGAARPAQWIRTTPGAWLSNSQAPQDEDNAFVVKISPGGDRIVYATLLNNAPRVGAAGTVSPVSTGGAAIVVDSLGFAYVTGVTNDSRYPTTPGALQPTCAGCGSSLFVSKLSPDGSTLAYSTYLGPADGASSLTPVETRLDPDESLHVVTIARATTIRARVLRPDGIALSVDSTVPAVGKTVTFLVGLVAVPDGHGNLVASAETNGLTLPLTDTAFPNGSTTVAVLRESDGAVLYSTRLPLSPAATFSQDWKGIAPDGNGGFLVLSTAGPRYSNQGWTLTRFVPDTGSGRPSMLAVANAAADNTSASVAPGELVSIHGLNLGPTQPVAASYDASGHLPYGLGGTQVDINGILAPLLYVSSQQVNVQVPFGVAGSGVLQVELRHDGGTSNLSEFPTADLEPQVFQAPPDASANRYALALNQDGTVNSKDNPAVGGSVMSIFINGAGAFTPAPADGTAGRADQKLVAPVSVQFNEGDPNLQILYAGAAPGLVGVMQLSVRLSPPPYSIPWSRHVPALSFKIGTSAWITTTIWASPPQ